MTKPEIEKLAHNGKKYNNAFAKKYQEKLSRTARSKALGLNKK